MQVSKESQKRIRTSWQNAALAIVMLGITIYAYDYNKPVMSYLEYLPVYRVELRWDRNALDDAATQENTPSTPQAQ